MRNNHRFSGHNLHLGCFYLIFLALSIGLFGQELQVNWDHIMKAAEAYVANPSSENALQLFNSIPESQIPASYRHEEFEKVSFYIFEKVLVRLYDLVIQADRNAVKAWIRLYAISDGAFSEDLNDGMGDLIQVDPKMFLEEINDFPWPHDYGDFTDWLSKGHIVCEGGILNKSQEEIDEKAAHEELGMRIKALETVTEKGLLELRDICINAIKEEFAKIINKYEVSNDFRLTRKRPA